MLVALGGKSKMAEEQGESTKISYNPKAIDTIVERVGSFYDEHIDENLYCSEEEKKEISCRMKEIYRSVLLENILLDNEVDVHKTSEETAAKDAALADIQKERHLNEVVLPELDSLICSVAENRKTMPPRFVQLLDQQCRYEYKTALQQESHIEPQQFSLPEDNQEEIAQITQQVSESSASIKQFSKSIHQTIADCKNLQEVLDMQSSIGKTKTDEVIFSHRPEPKVEEETLNIKESMQIDTLKQGFSSTSM